MANINNFTDPVLVDMDLDNGIAVNGRDFRHGMGGLGAPTEQSSYGYTTGVFPGGSPAANFIVDLSVGPTQPNPSMQTVMAPGSYQVGGGAEGPYWGAVVNGYLVNHDESNPTDPRYDLVLIRTKDPGTAPDGEDVEQSAAPVVLKGTPAANPTLPTGYAQDGDVLLAGVRVRAGATSIVQEDITDLREFVVARGGIYPKSTADIRPGSYHGQYRDDPDEDVLERWNGRLGKWQPMASPAEWTEWTPPLRAAGTNDAINIGSGALYVGRYKVLGRRLDFTYYWVWGTPPYNGFTGDIFTYLPPGFVAAPYNQWVHAHLWVNTSAFTGDFNGQALIWGSDNMIRPFFIVNLNDNASTGPYKIATAQSVPGGGLPLIVGGYPEGGDLTISGSIEIAD